MNVWAWKLLQQSELTIILLALALLVLGFALPFLRPSEQVAPMRRVPYALIVGLTTLAASVANFLWYYTGEAIHGGWLAALFALWCACYIAAGTCFGWAAMARAKSYSGSTAKGWFGLLPFVNLILIFARPQGEPVPKPALAKLTDGLGIVLALAALIGSKALDRTVETTIMAHSESVMADQGHALSVVALRLEAGELPRILQEAAATVSETRLDEIAVLQDAVAEGTVLTYHYALASSSDMPGEDLRPYLAQSACEDRGNVLLMRAGATFRFHYRADDGGPASVYDITLTDCTAA